MTTKTPSEKVTQRLQAALTDLIDLALQGKQAHWSVQGANFRSVHLHLDELIDEVRLQSDDVAERLSALGAFPDGRASTVAAESEIDAIDSGAIAADKVVRLFESKIQGVADRIKDGLDDLEEDPLSQDMLTGIATALEKQAWMFRAASV